jgi:hypothetical protein
MADLVLPDGLEITFDLRAITTKEYLGMFDERHSDSSSDKTLAKACKMEHKALLALPFEDYKRVLKAFFDKCNAPLSDPNSPSAST